ncbi:histidine kinase [bacterium]|nr:histidine kinase [bacterium]
MMVFSAPRGPRAMAHPRRSPPARLAFLLALLARLVPLGAADLSSLQYYGLGMEEGLANNSVYCATQDRTGLMWFGTFGGLSRYDGESFVTYRPRQGGGDSGYLAASVVFCLLEDSRGRLWIGTDGGGLARYLPETDSFEVFRADPSKAGSLSSDRVFALAEGRSGELWLGLGDGALGTFDPQAKRFSAVRSASANTSAIRCLLVDQEGRVWAGTEGDGLLRFDPSSSRFDVFTHDKASAASIASNVVRALLRDSGGRVWAGLAGGGVDLCSPEGFKHAAPRPGAAAPRDAVRALAQDAEGRIWVGYADSGLGSLDVATLELLPPPPGQAAMVRSIYPDRRGLMWVGFKDGGLRTYNLRSALFSRFKELAGGAPLRDLRGMCEDPSGRLLVGSDGGGIAAFDAKSGSFARIPGLPADRAAQKVYALLAAPDGDLWAGTDGGGLIHIGRGEKAKAYLHDNGDPGSLAGNVVWALHADSDGTLWVGTEGGGLDRFDPATGSFSHYRGGSDRTTLRGSSVRAIYRDSLGTLWVGTWDGGLSCMERGAKDFRGYGSSSSSAHALGDASVNCIFEDSEGFLWIGTGGSGLARLDRGTGIFTHFTESEGLLGATVYGVVEDRSGDLWVSTSMGLSRLDRKRGTFFNFGVEDGLASTDLAQNSLLLARDGSVWVGGKAGLTHFDPGRLPRHAPRPPVAILGIEAPDGLAKTSMFAAGPSTTNEIELGYRNAGLSFHIAVLDYVSPGRNRYAMRLEDRQKAWTELGTHNGGTIAPLAPGRYVLRAKGSNGNGIWNDEGTSLSILVRPPFWGTWWFRLGMVVAALGLVAAAIAIRLGSLRRRNALLVNFSRHVESAREEERIAAAREVHDEIGQHLAVLNIQAYWLNGHADAPAAQRKERVGEMMRSIADAMGAVKAVATALRPVALDALAFEDALRWYLRSFERRSGMKAAIEIGQGLPRVEGPLATALFRVLQEMLTNIIRHSGAKNVTLRYYMEGSTLFLEVRDDGVGIEEARIEAEDSFGIIGMRERCAAFGGTLTVRGEPGAGTVAKASVPYPPRLVRAEDRELEGAADGEWLLRLARRVGGFFRRSQW